MTPTDPQEPTLNNCNNFFFSSLEKNESGIPPGTSLYRFKSPVLSMSVIKRIEEKHSMKTT